jgi:hypothetical protein
MSETTNETKEYEYYFEALKKKATGIEIALDTYLIDNPQSGCYRRKDKAGIWVPAVYRLWGKVCVYNHAEVNPEVGRLHWSYCATEPIEYDDYVYHYANRRWPGDHEAVIGHNQAPPDDSAAAIADRVRDLGRDAEALIEAGEAKNETEAERAEQLAEAIAKLLARAKTLHAAEKQPFLDGGRDVDNRWKKVTELADDFKRRILLVVLTPFRLKRNAERKQEAVSAIASGADPTTIEKRPTGLRTRTSARIDDWKVLFNVLVENPKMQKLAKEIADAAARSGVPLPGTSIIKEKTATA